VSSLRRRDIVFSLNIILCVLRYVIISLFSVVIIKKKNYRTRVVAGTTSISFVLPINVSGNVRLKGKTVRKLRSANCCFRHEDRSRQSGAKALKRFGVHCKPSDIMYLCMHPPVRKINIIICI